MTDKRSHRLLRMGPRDPTEQGRASSPLELLFDLTFVIGVGVAAENLAESVAAGHAGSAVIGFVFAMFAILVAWINFAWFASAFDIDDWGYRVATMVQMIGVIVLALGLPATFASIEAGDRIDVRMLVAGYVVIRIGMVSLWLRVARQSEVSRSVALRNALAISVIQLAWIALAFLGLPLLPTFLILLGLGTCELLVPVFAQGRANATAWHPHHIADRYSAFAIIALGEGVVGTVASSRGALSGFTGAGWDLDAILVVVAGVGLTFSMWWVYFLSPFGQLLHHRPRRGYLFGYGHIPVLMAIAATGAGLHGVGIFLQHDSHLEGAAAIAAVAIPVAVYLVTVFGLHAMLLGKLDGLHLVLLAISTALLALAVVSAAAGTAVPAALVIVTAAGFVPVIGYEWLGHDRQGRLLAALGSEHPEP